MSAFTAQVGDSGVAVIKAPVACDLVRAFIAQVRQCHLCKQTRIVAFTGNGTAPVDDGEEGGEERGREVVGASSVGAW
jgi:hypothetical protein